MSAASAILMPKLGLTMTEGLVAEWRVQPGDDVKAGDVLFVVETEKIATEVEAQEDGRIETITVEAGETIPVGAVVATWTGPAMAAADDDGTSTAPPRSEPVSRLAGGRTGLRGQERVIATPLARRVARQAGLDLRSLHGSGPRGRIKAGDVEAALALAPQTQAQAAPVPQERPGPDAARRPATAFEKVVARRLTAAKQTIPHFYVLTEADVTRLLELRAELNALDDAPRISVNHFVVAAAARALTRMPDCNVLWVDDEIVQLTDIEIGIAVDTPRGLLAPVLRGAGTLSLDGIAVQATDLVERARAGALQGPDFEGGALAISNVGMYGATHLVPIINPGQSAILGVGALKPVFRPDSSGAPALRREIGLVLSCDHRVLDGVRAARLLDLIKQFLESPFRLLRG